MKSNNIKYFANIDVLRGFAALSVVQYHIMELYPWPDFMKDSLIGLWCHIGWMGVDLFFVISGFVIAFSMFNLLDRQTTDFRLVFMKRRIARIVPLHYLTCLLFVIFCIPALLFEPSRWLHIFTHLTFTHNLLLNTHGSINGANWSLGTEMQFYVLIVLIAPWLRRMRPILILIGGIVIAWAWRGFCFWYLHRGTSAANDFNVFFATTQLPGMLDEFAMGVLLARLYVDDNFGKWLIRLHKVRWFIPVIAAIICYMALHRYWQVADYWNNSFQVIFWRSSLALANLLAIFSAALLNDGWFVYLTRPLRYLGTISYGIYLWHLPVILSFKNVQLGDPARFAQYAVATVLLLAMLSWHFFEKPILKRYGHSREQSS